MSKASSSSGREDKVRARQSGCSGRLQTRTKLSPGQWLPPATKFAPLQALHLCARKSSMPWLMPCVPRRCRSPVTVLLFLPSRGSRVPRTSLLVCNQARLVFLRSEANDRAPPPSKHCPHIRLGIRWCRRTRTSASLTVCIPPFPPLPHVHPSQFGPYPCGHLHTDWTHCAAAKRKARFSLKPATHVTLCKSSWEEHVAANLEELRASAYLTKVFVCCQCPAPRCRVGWVGRRCEHMRCLHCQVWASC